MPLQSTFGEMKMDMPGTVLILYTRTSKICVEKLMDLSGKDFFLSIYGVGYKLI